MKISINKKGDKAGTIKLHWDIKKLLKEYAEDREKEFKKTKVLLKTLERIIRFARKEKWDLNYLIEELEVDIKNWRKSYNEKEEID